jgi:hypothetical protein
LNNVVGVLLSRGLWSAVIFDPVTTQSELIPLAQAGGNVESFVYSLLAVTNDKPLLFADIVDTYEYNIARVFWVFASTHS